jgi:solute carrier family 6 GABA transporter-like protein 1
LKGNFKKYEGVTPEVEAAMREADAIAREPVWSDATGQIFFSIGVCMGIMTSYGSYNDVKKPIIMDNFIISISNSMVSFISGFAVWSVVGYLQAIDSIAKSKTSSFGLAFVAYPTAIDTMNNSNAWAVLLGITLYLLGIDSAFSFVEATSTVITDTKWGSQWPRTFIAFVLCVFGFGLSLVFCTNFGFILLDVFDYYLSNGLLLVVGLLQCLGCGWGFDTEHIYNKSPRHANSLFALTMSYWTIIIMLGLICVPAGGTVGGLIAVLCSFPTIIMPISYYLLVPKESSFSEWYNDIFMCGVGRLGYSMSAITRKDPDVRAWWEPIFVFYYGFCIKYLCPCVLWFLNVSNIRNMIAKPYGGYSAGW